MRKSNTFFNRALELKYKIFLSYGFHKPIPTFIFRRREKFDNVYWYASFILFNLI